MALSQRKRYITFAVGFLISSLFMGIYFKHKLASKENRALPPIPVAWALAYKETPSQQANRLERVLLIERPRYKDIVRIEETIVIGPDGKEERLSRRITATDRIVVKTKPGITQENLAQCLEMLQGTIVLKRNNTNLYEIKLNSSNLTAVDDAVDILLQNNTVVERVVPLIIPESPY